MKSRLLKSGLGVFLLSLCLSVGTLAQSSSIPVVPLAKAKANLPPKPEKQEQQEKQGEQTTKKTPPAAKKRPASRAPVQVPPGSFGEIASGRIEMEPGVNEIIQVAVGHLNRIVTPYQNPKVTTASKATTEIRDNVVYIGTNAPSPLTLYITEKGSESQALSLTLIPRRIPPREIFLDLSGEQKTPLTQKVTQEAKRWEQSLPYVSVIQTLFRAIALGELPPGYTMQKGTRKGIPSCRQPGLHFNFSDGQVIAGHSLIVRIGVVTNVRAMPIEFVEESCGGWDVAAVSAFPRTVLQTGEKTEIYVAQKRHYVREITPKRPSLL